MSLADYAERFRRLSVNVAQGRASPRRLMRRCRGGNKATEALMQRVREELVKFGDLLTVVKAITGNGVDE